jgi:hypothetical protein
MNVRPELNDPSLITILYRCNTGLYFYYAYYHRYKYPYNRLCSNPLYPINRSFKLILKDMYLDIRGVIHHGDDGGYKELTCYYR